MKTQQDAKPFYTCSVFHSPFFATTNRLDTCLKPASTAEITVEDLYVQYQEPQHATA